MLLNEYEDDRSLSAYSIVIVDEVHERRIDTDIVFGIMKQCLKERSDMKVTEILHIILERKYFCIVPK